MVDVNILPLFLDDEEAIFEALEQHVRLALAVLEASFRDYPHWVKIYVDVEGWRRLGDPTFAMHFRMSRTVFEELITCVGNHLSTEGRLHRFRTPIDLCLMMAVWILMNMDTFKNTALHFHTTPGVILFHYVYVIEALREMAPQFIQWPSREERAVIKQEFFQSSGYPGVVGVIDGTHTFVTAPLEEKQAYVNRHHSHSILTQAVVDNNLLVRDMYTGECGSLHDSRVFRRSPLGTNLLENANLLEPDEHILGDGAYILTDKCIVPYDDNAALNDVQRYHNTVLSKCRSTVERSFALVKGKFPRLKYFRSLRIEYAVDHIVSTFVLHNFIILAGEPPRMNEVPPPRAAHIPDIEGDFEVDRGHGDFPDVNIEPDHPLLADARVLGDEKREILAARLIRLREA